MSGKLCSEVCTRRHESTQDIIRMHTDVPVSLPLLVLPPSLHMPHCPSVPSVPPLPRAQCLTHISPPSHMAESGQRPHSGALLWLGATIFCPTSRQSFQGWGSVM